MKSAILFAAMLSGLCAEVMASPIGDIGYIGYDNRTAPRIEPDLHFSAESLDEAFPDALPEMGPEQPISTDLGEPFNEGEFALDENQPSGSLGVPEPPSVTLVLAGLTCLGFFALGRRARRKRRQLRRVVVQMRAITAEP